MDESKNIKILILEGHPDVAQVTTARLKRRFAVNPFVTINSAEAIGNLKLKKFHIVIAESDIPDGGGDEVYDFIETISPYDRPKFVMFTNDTSTIKTKDASFKFLTVKKPDWNLLDAIIDHAIQTLSNR